MKQELTGLKKWLIIGIILPVMLIIVGCSELPQKKDTLSQNIPGSWITDERPLPKEDSLFYLDSPAPLFRKEFGTSGEIEQAILKITAAGYYKISVNGMALKDNVLDPAWTDYSKRIYYSEHDITPMISNENNCLGVQLGNGFYNPLPLRKWGRRNMREDTSVGKPAFIAQLLITYKNGQTEEIVSDRSWKYTFGPLLRNSVYIGVIYDANKENSGWDLAGYDDNGWLQAEIGEAPDGKLQKAFFEPVRITEEISPVEIYQTETGKYMVDMGVNFTGTFKMKLLGKKGDTIKFRFGERVYENGELNPMTTVIGQIKRKGVGGPGAPDIAWQTDCYIFGDKNKALFSPDFTYHTYRFMEIEGLGYLPKISDVKGLFIHSDVTHENHFSCSSDLLNQIQEACDRTFRANLVSVQSDCPAREKFGYGGDLNATVESFIYNYDMRAFYRKTIYDWMDAMNDSSFVDTAPFVGIKYCGISWESAYLITQYYLYLYYNDVELVKELYELNKKWMDKVARIHPEGLVHEGLSDHESLEPVPVELTGTCHYLECARIMQHFAKVMDDGVNEQKYAKLAGELELQLKDRFWDNPVKEKINRQTLFSALLYYKIIPENEMKAATDSLRAAVLNGPSGHFSTGIFGTKYILEALSANDSPEKVFSIVNSTQYPGWGHMMDSGATTIWETWKESDNTYSNCHPMFGSVSEWFYRWLGGIQAKANSPGFESFSLAPHVPDGLDWVKCSYHSPYGKIVSNWQKKKDGSCIYEMEVPEASTANVILPQHGSRNIEVFKNDNRLKEKETEYNYSGVLSLDGGNYRIRQVFR